MLEVPAKPAFIDTAVSYETDATAAVNDIAAQLVPASACFLLAFVPDGLVLDDVAAALNSQFAGLPMFGCTTAGQITPQGYETDALLVLSFPKAHFRCATHLVSPLKPLSIKQVASDVRKLSAQFQRTAHWSRLALTFSDGLSKQEDMLVAALQSGLEEMPVFGGSAGNGLNFKETSVFHMGRFHTDAAVIILLETDLEFAGLGFDHFLPTGEQMVVTEALPEERLALEINGSPAAEEYARLVGVQVDELSPQVFAENPVLVRNHELYHVRAIQGVQDGGALSFLSAIDMGLLLTLGRGQEILRTLHEELDVKSSLGKLPDFILGFDCFLRKLEIDQKDLTGSASEILREHRVLGFNTYGEQHCGVHVNQTFVGVAFYEPKKRDLH